MRLYAKLCAGLVITAVAVSVVLACWYQRDRTQMLESMCKIGLPNFSRPSSVSPETLGCVILSKKRRYSGFIETGFEHSFLISDDLPPTGGERPGNAWFTCNEAAGCDPRLSAQLAQPIPGVCLIRLASVTVEGWVTETPGGYGHMNMAEREFFTDRVISVGPPPRAEVEVHQNLWARVGGGDCP